MVFLKKNTKTLEAGALHSGVGERRETMGDFSSFPRDRPS